MSAKTIFIIVLTALVTIVLTQNTDPVIFWIFGDHYISKLAILGTMFALGLIVGFLLGRPRKKVETVEAVSVEPTHTHHELDERDVKPNTPRPLSNEDRNYLD